MTSVCLTAATTTIMNLLASCKFNPARVLLNMGSGLEQSSDMAALNFPAGIFARSEYTKYLSKQSPSAVVNIDPSVSLTSLDFKATSYAPWFFVECERMNALAKFSSNNSIKKPITNNSNNGSTPSLSILSPYKRRKAIKDLCDKFLVECFWFRGREMFDSLIHSRHHHHKKPHNKPYSCPILENFSDLHGHRVIGATAISSLPGIPRWIYALDTYTMETACYYLKCQFRMNPISGGFGVELPNKTWNGLIGEVQNGPDNNVAMLTPTWDRTVAVDFTTGPLYDTYNGLLSRKPTKLINFFVMVQPFQVATWICILGAIVFTSCGIAFLASGDSRVGFSLSQMSQLLQKVFAYTLQTLVSQCPEKEVSTSTHFRIGSLGFLLASIVLVCAYSSMLTALIALPNYERFLNTFEDVAILDAIVYSHANGGYANTKAVEDMKRLRGGTLSRPPTSMFPYDEILNDDRKRKAYTTAAPMLLLHLNMQLRDSIRKEFHLSNQRLYSRTYSFLLKKQSPYWRYFEHFSFVSASYGFPEFHERNFVMSKRGENLVNITMNGTPETQLVDYVAPSLILVIGIALSSCAFIVEISMFSYKAYIAKKKAKFSDN